MIINTSENNKHIKAQNEVNTFDLPQTSQNKRETYQSKEAGNDFIMQTDEQTNHSFSNGHQHRLKAMNTATQVQAAKRGKHQNNKATTQYIPVEPVLARENNVVPYSNSQHQQHT
eukprot:2604756-Heterocapsa_arctica.AAC.1